jgi:hypothetical protein
MTNYMSLGDRGYAPYQGGTNVYSASDTLDLIRGKHNIRFGATYRAEEMNIRNNAFQDGFVTEVGAFETTGDNMSDLLLGSMGSFAAHDQTFLGGTVGRREKLIRPFVQDDWRVTPNMTFNIGLAWALATPETEVENRQANFDVQNLRWYVPAGSPGLAGCTTCISSNNRAGIEFQKGAVTTHRVCLEADEQRQGCDSRGLRNIPRFRMESRWARFVAESAILRGSGPGHGLLRRAWRRRLWALKRVLVSSNQP